MCFIGMHEIFSIADIVSIFFGLKMSWVLNQFMIERSEKHCVFDVIVYIWNLEKIQMGKKYILKESNEFSSPVLDRIYSEVLNAVLDVDCYAGISSRFGSVC